MPAYLLNRGRRIRPISLRQVLCTKLFCPLPAHNPTPDLHTIPPALPTPSLSLHASFLNPPPPPPPSPPPPNCRQIDLFQLHRAGNIELYPAPATTAFLKLAFHCLNHAYLHPLRPSSVIIASLPAAERLRKFSRTRKLSTARQIHHLSRHYLI